MESEKPDVNAIPLQNAVLCADCEVVSDSRHETCVVCGSRSLLNLACILGGKLPARRAQLIDVDVEQPLFSPPLVLTFPTARMHGRRRRFVHDRTSAES